MTLPGFEGTIAIKVRGGWSRGLPKKSYAVEVRDAAGEKLHDARVRGGNGAFLVELTAPRQAVRKGPSFLGPVTRRPFVWQDPEREDLGDPEAARIVAAVARAE